MAATVARARRSLRDAAPVPYWLDSPARPEPADRLAAATSCDLAVVGAGFTGLWTALLAKEADPDRDVVLLDARTAGEAASGRNGGFCAASLTHGLANGHDRFPGQLPALDRLGRRNLDAIENTISRYGIDCGFERTGELDVATAPHQLDALAGDAKLATELGHDVVLLDRDEVRAQIASPTYVGGVWHRDDVALIDPARLVWGLRAACLALGVRLYESTPVTTLRRNGAGIRLRCATGAAVDAPRVALATNAFPALLRRLRPYTVPVYDYALVTEPLSASQREAVGWTARQGVGDSANQFHYYRLTADDRILWGGYDAIYYWRNGLRDELDQRRKTFERLAAHFFETFPQLDGLRFTHRWGGAIDTCTRFFAFQGAALHNRVAYSLGYTGLGVGASRFGAAVMLDVLDGRTSEAVHLEAPLRKPVPFPPEPLRWAGIQLTRRALARADRRQGRRGPWLRTLDRLGLGFDS